MDGDSYTYTDDETCKDGGEQYVGNTKSTKGEKLCHENGNYEGGRSCDVSGNIFRLGKSHVTHRWLRGVLKKVWAFLSTPPLKQQNTMVSAHKLIRTNPFVHDRYIRETGGTKSK